MSVPRKSLHEDVVVPPAFVLASERIQEHPLPVYAVPLKAALESFSVWEKQLSETLFVVIHELPWIMRLIPSYFVQKSSTRLKSLKSNG